MTIDEQMSELHAMMTRVTTILHDAASTWFETAVAMTAEINMQNRRIDELERRLQRNLNRPPAQT